MSLLAYCVHVYQVIQMVEQGAEDGAECDRKCLAQSNKE